MGAWQYCECGAGIQGTDENILRREIVCNNCGETVVMNMTDDMRQDILIEMYRDIQELKQEILRLKANAGCQF